MNLAKASALCSLLHMPLHAAISIAGPSTEWTPLRGTYDYLADQQTGKASGDIVGIGTDYGFFVTFDDNGPASDTDGWLGFRLRLDDAGGTPKNPAFTNVAWIGIDANSDGSIDAFLGLNMHGSSSEIGIHSPGDGSNHSPKTTTIRSTPYRTYATSETNYNYRPVDYLTDGGTTNDVTLSTKGDPDYYVSFLVPFADVASFLATRSISINDQTHLRYISATSTQPNAINQDLGGVNGSIDSEEGWASLGGFSQTVTLVGQPVPEPCHGLLTAISAGALLVRRRRGTDSAR